MKLGKCLAWQVNGKHNLRATPLFKHYTMAWKGQAARGESATARGKLELNRPHVGCTQTEG